MQGYSLDLRKRVVKAVNEEKQGIQLVAKRFSISRWTVRRYLKLAKQGELSIKKPTGRPRLLDEQSLQVLVKQAKEYKDWTLEQHAEGLLQTIGISLKKSSIGNYFKLMGITIKKDLLSSRAR